MTEAEDHEVMRIALVAYRVLRPVMDHEQASGLSADIAIEAARDAHEPRQGIA